MIKNAQILGDFEHFSYAQQLEYVNSLPLSEKTKAFTQLRKLWELRCQVLALNTDRQVEVVFICGKGGTGKTYYAKKLLKSLGYDYCISSSSNDPFQDYMGQRAIILDDLRDRAFEFEDLLKILDNNTSSSVRSRFTNKVFNGDMIVITSSVPLNYWYKDYQYRGYDALVQLYRRISCYVKMTEAYTIAAIDENGEQTDEDTSIVTRSAFTTDGLTVTIEDDAAVTYTLFFYDADGTFISKTGALSADFNGGIPENAETAKIMITPTEDEDGKVDLTEVLGYAGQITVSVNK